MPNDPQILPATSLIGNKVKNYMGENVGHVKELIIDPETGRIVGALLSRQDLVKTDEALSAVPWGAMTLSSTDGIIYVDPDIMEHPLRRERDWPDTGAPHWSRNIVVYTSSVYKAPDGSK